MLTETFSVTFVLTTLVVVRAAIVSPMATQRVKAAVISLVEPIVNIQLAVVSPTLELSFAVSVVVAISLSFAALVEKRTAEGSYKTCGRGFWKFFALLKLWCILHHI